MNRKCCMLLLCLFATQFCRAQQIYLARVNASDSVALPGRMRLLSADILLKYKEGGDQKTYLDNLFRLQVLAGRYKEALEAIALEKAVSRADNPKYADLLLIQHQVFAEAKLRQASTNTSFKTSFTDLFNNLFKKLDDKSALHISTAFITRNGTGELKDDFLKAWTIAKQRDSLSMDDALALCRAYYQLQLYLSVEAAAKKMIKEDDNRRYIFEDVLIKTRDGVTISAIVTRKRGISTPLPAALVYTIYADSNDRVRVIEPATYGYAGVMAYSRGKRFSPDEIVPFEDDGRDANDVITWISKQSWCNGKVGMYGGSYNGFTQWAAAKYANPALKTIVPYVAAIPGLGLPMENNVFLTANYGWAFYTTSNKYLNEKVYNDPQRWNNMTNNWYASGAAFRKIDSVDGRPNPWLQRWLKHPDYDRYWQRQVPYKGDYAHINIPVLTFTGYYDDGQISALHFLLEHLKYNPGAAAGDYLIIGPYDHFGAQRGGVADLRDYKVDPVALISTTDITFQWLDYILKNGPKPAMLKDKINYEVMGANAWQHAPSIKKMTNKTLKLYLSDQKSGMYHRLSSSRPGKSGWLNQQIDFADRKTTNNDYYPYPIIKKQLDQSNGLFFISKPFNKPADVNGMFSGKLRAIINKRDMDIGVVLYEVMPDGRFFELSYFLGRASYARDMSTRCLLQPGKIEEIPFSRSRFVSRRMSKGSRLLVVLNINKNPFAQINYGTGRDVSDETIADAKEPLKIKWLTDSYVKIPVSE